YQKKPARVTTKSYVNESPGITASCVTGVPSDALFPSMPCQWIAESKPDGRSFSKWRITSVPSATRIRGPGTVPLYARPETSRSGESGNIVADAEIVASKMPGSSFSSASAGGSGSSQGLLHD